MTTKNAGPVPAAPNQAAHAAYWVRELRSDHAGETGAVWIYKGLAAVARMTNDAELLNLARHHGDTEKQHLQLIESVLAKHLQSRLLIPWCAAGWLTGALPALFGRRAVYATIAAVETFVERHYQDQIDYSRTHGAPDGLLEMLTRCQADEITHQNEARSMIPTALPLILRVWCAIVGRGSEWAVMLARRL